ncbi:MAG: hypothetical protein V4616_13525 [Bacteroidota bacterium]
MKNLSIVAVGLLLSVSTLTVRAQLLPGLLTNFQKITVSQQSIFQGKVIFDQGLDLTGDARFLNNVRTWGDLSVDRGVSFPGLSSVSLYNYFITSDETGKLTRIPLGVLANQLENGGLQRLTQLTVQGATALNGDLNLAEGVAINGRALFRNNITALGDVNIAGALTLNNLSQVSAAASYSILGMQNGAIIEIPFPGFPNVPFPTELPCQTGSLALWEYSNNRITTDRCSDNVKVGIGTLTPREKLDVAGNVIMSGNLVAAGQATVRNVFAGRRTAGVDHEFIGKMIIGGSPIDASLIDKHLSLGFDGAHPFLDGKGGQLIINYYSGEEVAIGREDLTKTALLAGYGGIRSGSQRYDEQIVGKGEFIVTGPQGFTDVNNQAPVFLGDRNHYIKATRGKGISIGAYQGIDAIVVAEGGKVGMGQVNPGAKLEVSANPGEHSLIVRSNGGEKTFMVDRNGVSHAKEMFVELTGEFPDYVFKPEYKLMSLVEVEHFIVQNGRLPKMPSAEEVKKEGENIGEVTRLLTEKVEELTLYVIELQKQIEALKPAKK